jgi:outer membrane protein TolC
VLFGNKSRRAWPLLFFGVTVALAPASLSAQVSLTTVVDLAQRNSSAVKLAEADVRKAEATLSESKDVIIPSVLFGTGLPVFPEVGFTGTPPSIWSATVQSLIFGIPQKHYINAAHFGLRAATANLHNAQEQVALDASLAYIELDTVNREIDAAEEEQSFASRLVAIEQERAEAGVDPLSDLLQARLTAAQIKLKYLQLGSRAQSLAAQIAALTGLPASTILPDHSSIPEIPKVSGDVSHRVLLGVQSAQFLARSKLQVAKGDEQINYLPQLSFSLQYNRNTNLLNDVSSYFAKPIPPNNLSSGIAIQLPLFDMWHRAKARESAADALRARVEAEEAQHKNDVQIASLSGSLQELDAQAEVATLKQQIAQEQLKTVQTQLQSGNGAGVGPGAPPQLSPKAEQLARIDEREKYQDALESELQLSQTRLRLLRALGHMGDWLNELRTKQP